MVVNGRRWHRFWFHGDAVVPPRCRRHAASVPPFVGCIWTNAPLVLFCAARFHITAALAVPPARGRQHFVAGGLATIDNGQVRHQSRPMPAWAKVAILIASSSK